MATAPGWSMPGLKGAVALIAALLVLAPAQARSVAKVGLLWNSIPQAELDRGATTHGGLQAIEAGLRDLGWSPGKDVQLISRSAESRYERMPQLAAELANLRVDVIVVFGDEAAHAAQRHAPGTPIVWAGSYTLRAEARPSAHVTGFTLTAGTPTGKRLEILKTMAPRTARVAMLAQVPPGRKEPSLGPQVRQAARALSVDVFIVPFSSPDELPEAFVRAVSGGADAVDVGVFPELTWNPHVQARVLELSQRHKLATIYALPGIARAGGLIGYGVDDLFAQRRAAYFVDRILRGAKAADLPIEQVTKFELNINRRAARGLGLEIPPALALQADNIYD